MTLKELSRLHYLQQLIARDEEKAEMLRAQAEKTTSELSDMPRGSSAIVQQSRREELMIKLSETERRLSERTAKYERIERELETAIAQIGDEMIESILTFRFIELLEWDEVAAKVGGNNTEGSVKQQCYRFIRKWEKTCSKCSADT